MMRRIGRSGAGRRHGQRSRVMLKEYVGSRDEPMVCKEVAMKVVIIGGVAAGATAATRLRRLDERAEIVMLDKGPHVSFSNCSLPFRLSGTVDSTGKLVMMTPQAFAARYRIGARVNSEAGRHRPRLAQSSAA